MGLTDLATEHLAKIMYNSSGQTEFTNANAHIGVGGGANATDAFDATETDLQGASKFRQPMDAGYPKAGATDDIIQARATVGTADGNYIWDEWGWFNAVSGGLMFSRKVENFGAAKTGSDVWQLTIDLTINNP